MIATIKYDTNGNEIFAKKVSGTPVKIMADTIHKAIYVAGSSASDYLTMKYDYDGNLLWKQSYNGPAKGSDVVMDMSFDNSGYVYVTGTSVNDAVSSNMDYLTIK
jgi:hypothetical protein